MLDLSNTWVDDADISQLVEECSELRVLKLAGCRKLAAVSETLLTPDTGTASNIDLSCNCMRCRLMHSFLCHLGGDYIHCYERRHAAFVGTHHANAVAA